MCRRYVRDKQSIRTVAAGMGRSYNAVWTTLHRFKVPLREARPPSTRPQRPPLVIPEEERARIVQMYRDGKSIRAIAGEVHRGMSTVRKVLVDAEVEIRAQGYAKK
jgi:transposase